MLNIKQDTAKNSASLEIF